MLHVVPPVTDRLLTALLSGRAGRSIVDCARDKHIDLIVVGTHGRTGISHAILGSVAETVVRQAPCLVLTVPAAVLEPGSASAAELATEGEHGRPCLVCGRPSDELVCEGCRTRIRAEALEQKWEAERPGRRGSPV